MLHALACSPPSTLPPSPLQGSEGSPVSGHRSAAAPARRIRRFKDIKNNMAFDTKNLVLHVRRLVYSSIRLGYHSTRDYPVVLGAGIVLLFLHELCHPLFTFVLSSSPIFVLTALLLGAILSYGEPTVPLSGEEILENQETPSLKSKISVTKCSVREGENNVTVESCLPDIIDRDEVCVGERTSNDRGHDTRSEGKKVAYMLAGTDLGREVYAEKRTSDDNTHNTHCQEKNITSTEVDTVANAEYCKYAKHNFSVETEEHAEEIIEKAELRELGSTYTSSGNHRVMHYQYQLGEFMRSCWQPVIREDLPCSISETDLTDDSSSLDASMTDIIPMLEELDPLIELETGHPSLAFRDSLNSSSDNNVDSLEEEDVNSDEEAMQGQEDGKDNWKDVIDLNSLDMEMTDNLLEIRRAKNILRFELDKTLMDLQVADATRKLKEALSFRVQVPSISTPRQNSFDASKDSDETIELPKIPDSAPSVLHPWRNMFDLPFDQVVDHGSRLRETWTSRSYLQARQHRKHMNSYGQRDYTFLQHHNDVKLRSCGINGEDPCDSHSGNDAEQGGTNGKLFGSLEAHLGEKIKILSAAISDVGMLQVNYDGVDEDNKIANSIGDTNVLNIMKSVHSTSVPKDSVHGGDEQWISYSLPEVNNSEPYVTEANSMSEVNSVFKRRMDEVLVQSTSEPSISQPLAVTPEDELSSSSSSDSGMNVTETSSVEESNLQFAQLNEEAVICDVSDSNHHNEWSIRNRSIEALPVVNKHISELPIEDGSRELLTTGYQQTADISEAISDYALHRQTFPKLEGEPNEPLTTDVHELHLPEANSVEEINPLFKHLGEVGQLSNGDSNMSMSQDCELEVDPVELNSGLWVDDAGTLDGNSDSGFEVTDRA